LTICASTKTKLVAAAAVLVAAVATAAPPAGAAGEHSRAAAVMRSLDRLTAQRATLIAHRAVLAHRLAGLQLQLAAARQREQTDRANLDASRGHLAQTLVNQYKSGGTDPTIFVFSSGSFSEMVDRIDMLNRIGSMESADIAQISQDSALVRVDLRAITRRQAAVRRVADQFDREQAGLDHEIAARRSVLRSIDAKIRAKLAAERHRRRQLARSHDPTGTGTSSSVFFGDVTWYGPGFAGQTTADGEKFDPHKLTAASPWLPFNTMLRVTSTVTGRSVVVRVNDRGPFGHGVLDLSAHAARIIGLSGWQRCRIQIL
jgi:rare lipoprotein A (peptidoglycan hydrolase)